MAIQVRNPYEARLQKAEQKTERYFDIIKRLQIRVTALEQALRDQRSRTS